MFWGQIKIPQTGKGRSIIQEQWAVKGYDTIKTNFTEQNYFKLPTQTISVIKRRTSGELNLVEFTRKRFFKILN